MKKLAYTAALALVGLTLSAPAMANMQYGSAYEARECRVEPTGERHCWNRFHRWHAQPQLVVQDGQDVNSNTWADGSARATLPPHNSRGTSRPDNGNDSALWMNW